MVAATAKGKSLLIVEDGKLTRETLALILRSEGYETATAANGREAIEHLRRAPRPDLILLDMLMPVADGWDFLEERRRDAALAAVPVVIMTGFDGNAEWAGALGAAGLVRKPINIEGLLNLIRRCAAPARTGPNA